MSQQAQQAQPLRLRNPTPYHLMATQQQQQQQPYSNNSAPHPLSDVGVQHHDTVNQQQHPYSIRNNRDSPGSEQMEFSDSFSQNIMNSMSATSPLHEYQDDQDYNNNHMYNNRNSFSSTGGHPLVSFFYFIFKKDKEK
jgi:hypothetical protein